MSSAGERRASSRSTAPQSGPTLTPALVAVARTEGERWASAALSLLRGEGRAAGGWPHTMADARACVVALGKSALSGQTIDRKTSEELAVATYRYARKHWESHAARASDDGEAAMPIPVPRPRVAGTR